MEHSIFIARIFGLCYLIIGVGFLLNREVYLKVMDDFCKNTATAFYGGVLALVIGVVIILVHNIWVSSWIVMITIIGWGGLLKGMWMIIFPQSIPDFMKLYRKNKKLSIVHALGALIFGAVLTYFGFLA